MQVGHGLPAYFSEDDLAAYARATLQLTGAERVGNPYADDAVAVPVAARIARLSERNFLVAGLTARTHGLYDDTAVAPEELWFSPDVGDAMREYLRRIPPVTGTRGGGITAEALLTALAYAEAPGLPVSLWRPALRALDVGDVPEGTLTRFARSSAASFLVESFGGAGDEATFRLFHQALNDALFPASEAGRTENEQALTRAFLGAGRDVGWSAAPGYLLRSLPVHAIRARLVDEVLAEDEYLLHADLRRLLRAVGHEATRDGQRRGWLLSHTPEAITAGRRDRLAMFSVTEALDDLGAAYQAGRWPEAPYTARWAVAEPRSERAILGGHGRVTALCAVPSSGGRALLAVASTDGTIRLWDPETGEPVRSVDGPGPAVTAMCPVPLPDGRVLLVTGHADGALRGWDPETGVPLRELAVHPGRVVAACAIPVGGGRVLLASGGGRTARLWDPETGTQILVVGSEKGTVGTTSGSVRGAADSGSVPGGRATITDVCAFPRGDGRYLLAYGNDDGVAQLRDPETGELIRILGAPAPLRPGQQREPVPTRLAVLGGRPPLLAVGLHGQAADLWDPELGRKVSEKLGEQAGRVVGRLGVDPGQAREICVAPGPGGRPLLAVRGRDGAVRLLESPAGGDTRVLYGQVNQADTVCTVPLADGRALLAAGDDDGVVRVWDPQARAEGGESRATRSGTAAACTIPKPGGGMLLATGDDDHAIRLWDPRSGRVVRTLMGHKGRVGAVRPVVGPKDRLLLASGAEDGAVRLWDPADGTSVMGVNSVHGSERVDSQSCVPLTVKGRPLLAAGGRLWDLKSGRLIRTFRGPDGWFRDMRAVHPPGSRTLLATMSDTGTVRLWDPETARQVRALNDPASGTGPLCEVTLDRGRILLAAGGSDGAVRLWDLADGSSQPDVLRDQPGEVTALCMMEGPGGPLLAAGSRLGTVTLWDPRQLAATLTVPVHHRVQALAWADGVLCVGLSAGVIALQLGGELS